MGILEILGMIGIGIIILLFVLGMIGFLASLLYFHHKWEEQDMRDEEYLRTHKNT